MLVVSGVSRVFLYLSNFREFLFGEFLVFSAVRVLFRVILCPFLCALQLMMKLFVMLLMLWPLLLFRLSISMYFHRYICNPN